MSETPSPICFTSLLTICLHILLINRRCSVNSHLWRNHSHLLMRSACTVIHLHFHAWFFFFFEENLKKTSVNLSLINIWSRLTDQQYLRKILYTLLLLKINPWSNAIIKLFFCVFVYQSVRFPTFYCCLLFKPHRSLMQTCKNYFIYFILCLSSNLSANS